MRKLKLFLSLLMLLAFSVGNVWADEVTFNYADYKTKGGPSGTGSDFTMADKADVSIGDTKFFGNNSYAHFYGGGVTTITPASGVTITQIVLTASAANYNGYQSSGTMTWSTGSSSASDAVVTWTGSATAAFTLSHNKQIRWTSIVVTYSKGGGTPTCATPTFDPEDGETFDESIDVEIASTTDGATIYYTTDGSTPTTSSSVYSSALNFTETTTVKAIATKEGANNSAVASATYTKVEPYDGSILEITKTDFTTTSYDDNAGDHEKSGITFTTAKVYQSGGGIQFQKTNGLLYNKTDLGEISKIEITKVSGKANNLVVYAGTTENPSSTSVTGSASGDVTTYTFASGYGYFAIKCNGTGASNVDPIKIYYVNTAPEVATPSISGETPFVTSTTVTLGCTTEGASVYYTTNGSDPSSSSTLYTEPFALNASATVKAIAIKGSSSSAIASKEFTKIASYTTLAEIYAKAVEVGGTSTPVYVIFDGWKISAVKGSQAYLTDGTNGLIIYQSGHGFNVGDALSGTVACNLVLFKGAGELTGLTSTSVGLTVTPGSMSAPVVKTIDAISAVNTGALVTIENVIYDGTDLVDASDNKIKPYTSLYSFSMTSGKKYNVTGIASYYDAQQILPRSAADVVEVVEAGAPEAPTFSVPAGTYTSVQSVELSCATEDAIIYYTTDGSTPDNTSSKYTTAISVGESMTINAIAIKNDVSSVLATAAYTINLPENPETSHTWNLAIDETKTASTTELTWTATYVSMSFAKGTSTTNTNNYYPGTPEQSYTSTRAYKNSVITITPSGKQITSVVFTATTSGYATALKNSAWTNANATASDVVVTVTPTDGELPISAVVGGTTGFTSVKVNYTDLDLAKPATPTFSPTAGTYTSAQSVEISCETVGATIYYTTDGSTPTNESTEYTSAISVSANMTIKAIAIKDAKSSSVATAAYEINIADETISKTWDLSIDETATASDDELTWTATYVDMSITRGTSTKANNYYPGIAGKDYVETRFYNGATLTITPNGKQITSIVITANASGSATALKNGTWTNGIAVATGSTVTVTVSAPGAVSVVLAANSGATAVKVNYGPIDESLPVAPTFSPVAGTYSSAQSVELSCETVGATIYYTTDGTNPTSASTEYTSAIAVNEDMTIKAVAIKDEKVGPIVTAAYTINLPLTTMDAILTRATAIGGTAQEVNIQFNNWVVSGIGTDEKTVYITDGTKGFIIYGSDHGFAVNDKLSGTVACNLKLYSKVAEVIDLKANAEGLTVAKDGVVTPVAVNIADLGAVNTGAPIIINNVKFDGTNLTDGTNSIKPYNTLFAYDALVENKYYNVTGIYVHYNSTKEVAPRSAADIEELSATAPAMTWYVDNLKSAEIAASHVIRVGDAFAPYFETNSDGELTYSSSDATIAEMNSTTGALTLKGVVGSTIITCAVAADAVNNLSADSKSFTLQVKAAATIDNIVIIAQFNDGTEDKWLAMKHNMSALEVNYHDGKIWDLPVADQSEITWVRTDDGENVTFQVPSNNNYLKGSTGSTMSVAAGETGHYSWHWETDGFYTTITSGTLRTPLYQGNADAFKYYAVSNAGSASSGGYSKLPQVVAAAFDATPVEPSYTDIRTGLTAGNYYTVCWPKAMTAIKGGSLWSFAGKDASMAYLILEEAPFEAGKPYIIYATAEKLEAVVEGDDAAAGSNNGLYGTLSYMNATDLSNAGATYMLKSNELRPIGTNNHLDANRAYVILDNISGGAPANVPAHMVRKMPLQGQTTTDIDALNASENPVKMMIDGQLFILRGEKLYDATGRLVK